MGKLLALELFNFKSYKGHHVLRFGDSYFTSIIGPNGSGKSNSMDAISFVLGIKSSHLRSTHVRDLVYRGRVLQHSKINADGSAMDEAPNGHVNGDGKAALDEEDIEVENVDVQATRQRNDPRSAWVMAVYEDDAGEEQRWMRSITASGTSEYRINKKIVTAKEYNDALEHENILIRARNFLVFQGDVEAIASQSPKDLTRLIEQISGSLEYKADYEKLKVEKEKADEDQAYKLTQRRAINGEIKAFKEQKDELEKFEQLRTEKDEAVVGHVLWKLFHFQRTIEDSTAKIQKHQAELKEFRRNVRKFEDRLDAAKGEQAKVGRDVSKHEREIKRKEKAVEEKENALVPIDEKLAIHAGNLDKLKSKNKELASERNAQQKSTDKMRHDLESVQKAQQRWEAEWRAQQQQAGRELSDQDNKELGRLRKEVYKRVGNDQNKLENVSRQLKTDDETVKSLKSKVDNLQGITSSLNEEVTGLNGRRTELQQSAKATKKEIETKKVAINSLISDRDRTAQVRRELDEKLHHTLLRITEAQGMQRESQKETQKRETVAQMKRIFPGVRGMVGQLCKPKQKKYETAIATVLGRHFDAIIVDTEKTAKECIQYLKDQRAGQATFIPLDTIIHKQPDANLRGAHQGTRLAVDTIDFDASIERAMTYACGNAIITDTLNIARTLCFQRGIDAKAVTLDGTIIHKGGNMTGGEGLHDKKRRFEDAEVDKWRKLAEQYKADIDKLPKGHKHQSDEEQLQSELIGLETRLRYAEDELNALQRNVDSKTRERQHAQTQLDEVSAQYAKDSKAVEVLRTTVQTQTNSISGVEDEVLGAFCRRLGYSSYREYEKQQGSLQQEGAQKKLEFQSQITRLENQVKFEEERLKATQARIKNSENSSKRDQDMIRTLQAEREQISSQLDQLNAEIETIHEQLGELRKEYGVRGEAVDDARKEVQKRSKSVEGVLKDVSALEAEIQKAATGRYGVLRTCKVENIRIPLEKGSRKIDTLPLENIVLEEEEQDQQDMMDVDEGETPFTATNPRDYGIKVDFSNLADDLKEDGSEEYESGLQDVIHQLQTSLDKMAPNMRSAERLEATEQRLQATDREFTQSRSAARDATKQFEEVRQMRMDLFNKAFTHISEQIGPVYRELTKTPSFPLGGSASLDVEDEDEPYLSGVKYHAMPPLKRFRDMEHLSGGEKTMAALALLFAVHTYAPSPFFVLDEVDAALDHANTMQLAQYVREHAGPGMQFVVISLKTGLFQNSETLVGVMRDQAVNSSRALTLDLRKYQAV